MSSLFLVLLILYSLNQTTSIGGGSWFEGKCSLLPQNESLFSRTIGGLRFEGKRSLLPQNESLFSRTITFEFKRIKTAQNKLNYLRKLCKTILKNSQENEGIAIVKACKKNLP